MADILGKTRQEVEEMLNEEEIIELKLSEKRSNQKIKSDKFGIYEMEKQ